MVEYLLEQGADVNKGQRSSSLHYAACFGRPNIVKVMPKFARVVRVICCCCFKLLLRYDANPDLRDEDGQTALQKAQERDSQWHQQVAEILQDPCKWVTVVLLPIEILESKHVCDDSIVYRPTVCYAPVCHCLT